MTASGAPTYFLVDGHGSTIAFTDATGATTKTLVYTAYGDALNFSTVTVGSAYLFGGDAMYDPAAGLYLHGDGTRGTAGFRFVEADTEGNGTNEDPLSLHRYLYGTANPVSISDPSGRFGEADQAVSLGLMAVLATIGGGITLLATRNPSAGLTPAGTFVPFNSSPLEVHYNSIEIAGSKISANQLFKKLTQFSTLNLYPVSASGNVTGVNGVVSFDMQNYFMYAGQGDFSVKVTKFDPNSDSFVVRTLSGHPLAGYRYWGIKTLPNNDIVVETFSVEQPSTEADSLKMSIGGLSGMYETWTNMLQDLLLFSGGSEVPGPNDIPDGMQIPNIDPYLKRVEN